MLKLWRKELNWRSKRWEKNSGIALLQQGVAMCMISESDRDCDPALCRERSHVLASAKEICQCVECGKTLSIGKYYRYVVGRWAVFGKKPVTETFPTCMDCVKDWQTLIMIVEKKEGGRAFEIYGCLAWAVADAAQCGVLPLTHRLVKKWRPKLIAKHARYAGEDDECLVVYRTALGRQTAALLSGV